jgi:hypothetical protein
LNRASYVTGRQQTAKDDTAFPHVMSVKIRACGAYGGGGGELCTGYWWGSLREGGHWGDPDIDVRIILRGIFQEVRRGCGDWMERAQDRDR